jgi:hypothetical protein
MQAKFLRAPLQTAFQFFIDPPFIEINPRANRLASVYQIKGFIDPRQRHAINRSPYYN